MSELPKELVAKVTEAIELLSDEELAERDKEDPYEYDARRAITATIEWMKKNITKDMVCAGDDAISEQKDYGFSSNADGDRYEYEYIPSGAASFVFRAMLDAISQ